MIPIIAIPTCVEIAVGTAAVIIGAKKCIKK